MRSGQTILLQRLRRESGGASAIEFAIVAPIFFILVFGIVVYGYYFGSLSLVHHIAYESARASVSGLTDDERAVLAQARADELITALSTVLDADSIQVETAAPTPGVYSVTVHYHFGLVQAMGGTSILPLPGADQSVTVSVSHGGY
jgi:Flp pilus assembly protein TadG